METQSGVTRSSFNNFLDAHSGYLVEKGRFPQITQRDLGRNQTILKG